MAALLFNTVVSSEIHNKSAFERFHFNKTRECWRAWIVESLLVSACIKGEQAWHGHFATSTLARIISLSFVDAL